MIASQYAIGDYEKKVQTFVYTNVVPQFAYFNIVPWRNSETKLIRWGRVICSRKGEARNVQMFIVVGAMPSTSGPMRFYGRGGFSELQDNSNFRVNVPSWMWTASCCTYEYTKDGRTYYVTKSTAFWRENNLSKDKCNNIDVDSLEKKLKVNLFPSSNECKNKNNYVKLL